MKRENLILSGLAAIQARSGGHAENRPPAGACHRVAAPLAAGLRPFPLPRGSHHRKPQRLCRRILRFPLELARGAPLESCSRFAGGSRCMRRARESSHGSVFRVRRQVCSNRSHHRHGELLAHRWRVRDLGGEDAPRRDGGDREFPAKLPAQEVRVGHEGSRRFPPIRSRWPLGRRISPVSSPSSTCMMVMPVSLSPARMAACTGAAPR